MIRLAEIATACRIYKIRTAGAVLIFCLGLVLFATYRQHVTAPVIRGWAISPAYTHTPPITLSDRPGETLLLLTDSEIHFTVHSSQSPFLRLGANKIPFTALSDEDWKLSTILTPTQFPEEETYLAVETADGTVLMDWHIDRLPDYPPHISFQKSPILTDDRRLSFTYNLQDNYGLSDAFLRIEQTAPYPASQLFSLPLLPQESTEISFMPAPIFEPGALLSISLFALDVSGQTNMEKAHLLPLPPPPFLTPTSRTIMMLRQELSDGNTKDMPQKLRQLAGRNDMEGLTDAIRLPLLMAARLLEQKPPSLTAIRKMLLETAASADTGRLAVARRNFEKRLFAAADSLKDKAATAKRLSNFQNLLNAYIHFIAQFAPLPARLQDAADEMKEALATMIQLASVASDERQQQYFAHLFAALLPLSSSDRETFYSELEKLMENTALTLSQDEKTAIKRAFENRQAILLNQFMNQMNARSENPYFSALLSSSF